MLRYFIPTMTCGGCARAVTRIVQAAGGTDTDVAIDLATREVRVAAEPSAEPRIREALARGGYPAEPHAEAPALD